MLNHDPENFLRDILGSFHRPGVNRNKAVIKLGVSGTGRQPHYCIEQGPGEGIGLILNGIEIREFACREVFNGRSHKPILEDGFMGIIGVHLLQAMLKFNPFWAFCFLPGGNIDRVIADVNASYVDHSTFRQFETELSEHLGIICPLGSIEDFDTDNPAFVVIIDDHAVGDFCTIFDRSGSQIEIDCIRRMIHSYPHGFVLFLMSIDRAVIASAAKQSRALNKYLAGLLRRFTSRNDVS